jgi:hypothetical protein
MWQLNRTDGSGTTSVIIQLSSFASPQICLDSTLRSLNEIEFPTVRVMIKHIMVRWGYFGTFGYDV